MIIFINIGVTQNPAYRGGLGLEGSAQIRGVLLHLLTRLYDKIDSSKNLQCIRSLKLLIGLTISGTSDVILAKIMLDPA